MLSAVLVGLESPNVLLPVMVKELTLKTLAVISPSIKNIFAYLMLHAPLNVTLLNMKLAVVLSYGYSSKVNP